ncbi:MAG: cupin domain-containing protein [Opitutales bacterium]
MEIRNVADCPEYVAPDDAIAQELCGHNGLKAEAQSMARIIIPPGVTVEEHHHIKAEEVYYIASGRGRMFLDGETREMGPGDAVVIRPGQRHSITNLLEENLEMVVTCSPPWHPDDQIF